MDIAYVAATMARRGLLRPGPPLRVAAQVAALHRWGFSLAGELRQAAARHPDRVAVIDERRGETTYADLLDRAERLARAWQAAGLRPGERVGVLCRNHGGLLEAVLAATMIGVDPVLGNTGLPASQLAAVAASQKLRALVHDADLADLTAELPPDVTRFTVDELDALIGRTPAGRLGPPPRQGRTIVLTSGTTGTPKGARRRTPGGPGPLCSIIGRIPLHAGDRILIAAPLFHTWGYAGLQVALALGATIVVQRRFEPVDTLAALSRHRCTALIAVPVMVQRLLDVDPPADRPPLLRAVAVSGSALPGGLATRFMDAYGDVLYNLYGSTEASWASIATPADLRRDPHTAGRAPHGTRLAILDDAGRDVPTGTIGRIFVGNDMLFEGYTSGAGKEQRDGLLSTGDLGRLDADGLLTVVGRDDDMIVSGGENVFPSDVERLLAARPEIREVAVVGVVDAEFGQRLAAYVVLRPGATLDAEQVREHVRRERARFCVPRDVVYLPELPRNATGKVLTRQLRLP